MNSDQKNQFMNPQQDTMVVLNVEPLGTPSKDSLRMGKGKTNQKST
jgi:hypothetical protein